MNLTRLSILKLKKIRQRLNSFLYNAGFNVALDNAEKRKTYKRFIAETKKALLWQVNEITKPENFNRLMEVIKIEKLRIRYFENKSLQAVFNTLFGNLDFKTAFEYGSENSLGFYFKWGADLGGQAAIDKLGIEAIFGVINPEWLKFLESLENLLVQNLDLTTKEWLAAMLREGLENQLSVSEMVDLLVTEAKGMSDVRAEMIVLTELANVMNQTELEFYEKAGFRQKRWRTSRDERVCPACAPLDNQVVKVDELFSIGEMAPPAHPRCRCFIQAVVEDWWDVEGQEIWLGE